MSYRDQAKSRLRAYDFFIRTQGLVSSAEDLGVTRDTDEEKSTEQTEASPALDRAALYR